MDSQESQESSLFEQAMARYQAGAPAADLIDDFVAITEAAPRQSSGWTCLAWLLLLCDKPDDALRSARLAVKLNSQDPQARINLTLAMLETKAKGVRDQIAGIRRYLALPIVSGPLHRELVIRRMQFEANARADQI